MATERTVLVRLKANVSDFNRAMLEARGSLKGLRNEIDTTNDRTAWLAQSILALGPAAVPIGAVAVPMVAALATQMVVAGLAAGTLGLAFNGVGDGLKALNTYQLQPTAENLEKLNVAMEKLGPDGEHFVRFLDDAGSQLSDLQMVARQGAFPGMEEGITHLLTLLPQARVIIGQVASGIGQLSEEAGQGLAGDKFESFFDYLETDARPILMDMGHTVGFLTEGFANLLVGFGPLTMDFSNGMEGMARSFAEWSRSLDENSSFQDFLQYIEDSGPRVREFFGALSAAFVGILRAGAPVGEVLLPALTKFLDVIGDLANTPLGPTFLAAAAAMSIYGRAVALASVTTGGLMGKMLKLNTTVDGQKESVLKGAPSWREWGNAAMHSMHSQDQLNTYFASGAEKALKARESVKAYGKQLAGTAGQVGLMAFAASGLSEKFSLQNTTMMAMVGNMVGPYGAAIGATIGAVMDLKAANDSLADATKAAKDAMGTGDTAKLNAALDAQTKAAGQKYGVKDVLDVQGPEFTINPLQNVNRLVDISTGKFGKLQDQMGEVQGELLGMAMWGAAKQFMPINQVDLLNKGLSVTAAGAKYASMSVQDFANHLQHLNNILEDRASMRDYQASLDDFRKGLKKGDHAWDIHYAKGRQNQALLDNIAATAIRMTKNMSQADKIKTLSRARGDFIRAAEAAGIAHAQAVRLANRLLGMNAIKSQPKVELKGAQAAIAAANAIKNAVNNIPFLHTITIEQRRKYTGNNGPGSAGAVDRTPYAGGKMRAMYPGETTGPTDDSIPAMVSHDEWVIRAASARKYGDAFMAAVNAGTYRPIGYAAGGRPGMTNVSVSAAPVSIGDTVVRVLIDGKELDARVELLMDQRDDVAGSYDRAVRTAD